MGQVASYLGAWIEIVIGKYKTYQALVASHMGAWIEIKTFQYLFRLHKSHPLWVRGLKFVCASNSRRSGKVASFMGAWIEFCRLVAFGVQGVAWGLDQTLEMEFVLEAMQRTLSRHNPTIINSDQGSQFANPKYIKLLKG